MLKQIFVAALCCYVALEVYARPGRRPRGPPPPVRGLVRLCRGLDDGNITNSDTDYDAVFTDLAGVCEKVLEIVAEETGAEEKSTDEGRKGGRGGSGGRGRRPRPTSEPVDAVTLLERICDGLDFMIAFNPNGGGPLNETLPLMDPICDAVDDLADTDE